MKQPKKGANWLQSSSRTKKPPTILGEPDQLLIQSLMVAYQNRRYTYAEQTARKLLRKWPKYSFGWQILGAALLQMKRLPEAHEAMLQAVMLAPNDAAAHINLATVLLEIGKLDEAAACFKASVDLNPNIPEAHNNLGNALMGLGLYEEAERSFRKSIDLKPDYFEALNNLGNCLRQLGRLIEAETRYREAIRLEPNYVEAHNNIGNVLQDLGRHDEAIASYRDCVARDQGYALAYSNLLYCQNFGDATDIGLAVAQAKEFGERLSAMAHPKCAPNNSTEPFGKLRIGFVSGDFKRHPVGYFIQGLLKNLDRDEFEIVGFPSNAFSDDLTETIRDFCSEWIPIYGMDDALAAETISRQGIHVLFDLSGHTAHNRLSVFAYKPAPVQVSWLGYFATTGLPEMDYFLGDPVMCPVEEEAHFSEKVWRLPETWLCLEPPVEKVQTLPIPALENGHITFGCFGNLAKMGPKVVETWAAILKRVPDSKLFLKSKQLSEPKLVENTQKQFLQHGIEPNRLVLEPPSSRLDYFHAYNQIDIVLDTFPYPGGTTSVDALWMGKPVLTLKGDRFLSHLGESIVTNAGLKGWIAKDHEDYIEKAMSFAADRNDLAKLSRSLREIVLKTPLFDTERFARGFSRRLKEIWDSAQTSPSIKN